MGIEVAERSLLGAAQAMADDVAIELRVIGGRAARRYAQSLDARWIPSRPGKMPRRAARDADLVHLLALDAPPRADVPYLLTIHDLGGLHFIDEARFPEWTADAIRGATKVITPSRFTADELASVFDVGQEKLRVVANGPGQAISPTVPPLGDVELAALRVRAPFVLRMGGYTKRKNVSVLLDAWPAIRGDTARTLVLAGPPHPLRNEQLAAAPTLDGVVTLDYLPSATLVRLLRSASVLVSTSTYEGFGLPPLEAMAAGVPVVAVRSPSVEEVCGPAALLADNDSGALASAVARALSENQLRGTLTARGLERARLFTWDNAGAELLGIYRDALGMRATEGSLAGER
jgi:glycosyltransferase involved in cell wall biosynthesis